MLTCRRFDPLCRLAFTAILLGYLLVWLPQPVAGLSFIGLEMGEWVKFLPQVQSGEILPGRNLFYLPPITLGLMMALWTANWPNRRWQTWLARGLAVLVSALAFPAIEAIRYEPATEWWLRLALVGLVALVAVTIGFWSRRLLQLSGPLMLLLGLIGAVLPTWAYLAVQPVISQLFSRPVDVGPGLWLNLGGHLMVVSVYLYCMSLPTDNAPAPVRSNSGP